MGNSSRGHVCRNPQHASSPVYVSSSEASSTGGRCPVTGLAGEVDLHVSTISPAQQSYSEAQDHPGGRGDTNSPLVAITTMVSTLPASVCDYPRFFPYRYHNSYRPAVITGIYLERQIVPSARMEALMQHYQAAGFTKEVSKHAPERPSMNKMYNDRWLRFANWATGKGFDPLGPTAAQLATFLYELFDTHALSPLTIKAYRSCLASVLSRTGKAAAVQTETISDMIMSVELQRPRLTLVLPQWDLSIVLEALSTSPYEPPREASLKPLTLKTVFLLAIASAGRRSELQALLFDPQYIYSSNLKVRGLLYISPQSEKSEAKPSQ